MTKYKYTRKEIIELTRRDIENIDSVSWNYYQKLLLATVDKPDKECVTCGCQKKSNPTPDGDEICPSCGGDCLDIPSPRDEKTISCSDCKYNYYLTVYSSDRQSICHDCKNRDKFCANLIIKELKRK